MINRKKGASADVESGQTKTPPATGAVRGPATMRRLLLGFGGGIAAVLLLIFLTLAIASPKPRYAVVIDAGSTGSRVHVYEFAAKGSDVALKDELFVQLKPGLSSYATEPSQGAQSLQPLLDRALERIPPEHLKTTPVMIGATAGLRMLPGTQADELLDHSRKMFCHASIFQECGATAVSIMSGDNEGKFAWLAVNMLTGNLGKSPAKTVGVIDLGGGSVQMMKALAPTLTQNAPSGYVLPTTFAGTDYSLYVHSFLGYGLMAGRLAVLSVEGAAPACMASDVSGTYKYNDRTVDASGAAGAGSFEACLAKVKTALKLETSCGRETGCAFDGHWGGGADAKEFYLLSYLYERIQQSGAGSFEPEEGVGVATVAELRAAATRVCGMNVASLKAAEGMEPEDPDYFCLDLAYIYGLLHDGFGISGEFKMAKKFDIESVQYEAAWSLGAALEML